MAGAHLSRDFFELIKAIGESKSKQVRRFVLLARVRTRRTADVGLLLATPTRTPRAPMRAFASICPRRRRTASS